MKFSEFWTDAKNRPALELIIGTLLLIPVSCYAFGVWGKPDGGIIKSFHLFDAALFGINAAGNVMEK